MESSIESQNASSRYRSDIDGLRAVAVLSVVFFHAGVPFLKGGFVGVDIFFVISGYLIGAHVYSDIRRGRFKISDFYRKRAKRILPALLVLLVFCYIVALFILSPHELWLFGGYSIATIISGSNVFAWLHTNYFAQDTNQNPLLMTWSLGVEEQFYVLFPILMVMFAKARRKYLFLGVLLITSISLAACILNTPKYPTAIFYLLPTRMWEIAVGVLLAIYEEGRDSKNLYFAQRFRHAASGVGILLIVASVVMFDSHTSFPGYAALMPVCGALCMLSAPNGWANRLLSYNPFTFFGLISYSLYLWHWPLLSFARIVSVGPLTVTAGCSIVSVSIFCAWLSYRFVEQPYRRSKSQSFPLLVRYGVLCGIILVPAMLFRASSGLPQRFPKLRPIENYRAWELDPCSFVTSIDQSPACVDVHDPRPGIALFGDSHAETISAGLRKIANQSGFKMYEIVKHSCAPLTGVIDSERLAQSQECLDHNAQVIAFLRRDERVKIVVIAAYWEDVEINDARYVMVDDPRRQTSLQESRQNLATGLGATVEALQSAGKKIILMQDVPIFKFDPMRRIRLMYIPFRGYLARELFHIPTLEREAPLSETFGPEGVSAAAVISSVAASEKTGVFDPKKGLCAPQCLFFDGQYPIYFDNQHVTPIGSESALSGLAFTDPYH